MGNFNLKNIWAPKAGGGGSIPSNLEQRVQELENDTLKLGASAGLQIVNHTVDFKKNVVFKNEAFVDVVGNGNTNITNKQYVDTKDAQNVKLTGDQSIAGVKTFTGQVAINSGNNDFTWNTTRTWAENIDNTVVRTGDLKYSKAFETLSTVNVNTSWSTGTQWTVNGVNTNGAHEFLICVAISNVLYTLNGKVVWKPNLTESKSQFISISDGGAEYMFQIVIKPNNTVALYHKKTGGSNNLQWVRGYIIRGYGLPWKMNELW